MKSLMIVLSLMVSGSAFAAQTGSDKNTNVASCCDSCYLAHSPGAVPCNPSLAKSPAATYTAPTTGNSGQTVKGNN